MTQGRSPAPTTAPDDVVDITSRVRGLTDAAAAINTPTDLTETLTGVTRTACEVTHCRRARTILRRGERVCVVTVEDGTVTVDDVDPVLWPDAQRTELLDPEGASVGHLEVLADDGAVWTEATRALLGQLGQVASNAIARVELTTRLAAQEAARFREELLSGISHDMQTPLATIVGLSDLLVRDEALPPDEQREIHRTISRQARALRGLVQQFLDFSRLESDRPLLVRTRPTDVEQAIDRVVSLFSHQREIVVGVAHGLPQLEVDPDRLDQILSNLISNAIKFSDEPVRIVARRAGAHVAIDVVDEGEGIAEDEQARLFEKFHRGAAAGGTSGTGLGLYITRALVQVLGGTISVHSNAGVGSRFTVTFPRVVEHR